MPSTNKSNNKLLLRYAGLATELLALLAVAVWIGMKLDKWLNLRFPLLIWLLPLAANIALMIKIIKDTSKRK